MAASAKVCPHCLEADCICDPDDGRAESWRAIPFRPPPGTAA